MSLSVLLLLFLCALSQSTDIEKRDGAVRIVAAENRVLFEKIGRTTGKLHMGPLVMRFDLGLLHRQLKGFIDKASNLSSHIHKYTSDIKLAGAFRIYKTALAAETQGKILEDRVAQMLSLIHI